MNQSLTNSYAFGDFVLQGAERQLLRTGTPVPLAPKVFDTLQLLLENSGHLVEKDEFMRQLWPDTFVGEDALARNISILRKALGESSDSQSFIATVPTRGYRFVAPVQKLSQLQAPALESNAASSQTSEETVPRLAEESQRVARIEPAQLDAAESKAGKSSVWSRRVALLVLGIFVGSIAGVITFYLLSPVPIPRVIRSEQLTHSGRVDLWARVVTDGARIYFTEREGDHWNLVQTSVSGGASQIVNAPFRNTVVLDASPDRSSLLIANFEHRMSLMPLWIWPVQGGALKRVGQIEAYSAVWCPDGRQILYSQSDGIYIADSDGMNVRRFAPTDGLPGGFSWSPDGRILRFDLTSYRTESRALWEIHSDGSQLHPLLDVSNHPPHTGPGAWSPFGKYFFFGSSRSGIGDIWGIRASTFFSPARAREPVRIASGPLSYNNPVMSRDGRKLFVFGASGGGELIRYDLKSHKTLSIFPGVCVNDFFFSTDGAWVACHSASEQTILRMKADGSDRLAVTPVSLNPEALAWSPDSRKIVFTAKTCGGKHRLFLVSADGGDPKELFPDDANQDDPAWSPDGKQIAFIRTVDSSNPGEPPRAIHVLDLSKNQLTVLPESLGIRLPAWSPDGRHIAAVTIGGRKVMLFDLSTRKWTELADGALIFGPARWSPDGGSIYFQDVLAADEPVYRFRFDNRKKEVLASFEDLLHAGAQRVVFRGFSPDGSLILDVDHSIADVYALDLDLP
jgi:Tol biopolymer transport system component/DNA-binding winged helix-turn-helix (wHTH) protein